jgi:carboxypeptidase Taq
MLQDFYLRLKEIYHLGCIQELLGWDQQVNLPPQSGEGRAAQLELMSKITHDRVTNPEFLALVENLQSQIDTLSPDDQLNVRETFRSQQRERRLPTTFVAEQARAHAEGYQRWVEAKPKNDFAAITPSLERIVALARQESDLVGFEGSPYNALFDKYEPYGRIETVRPLLLKLADALKDIIPPVSEQFASVRPFTVNVDQSIQARINVRVAREVGYSFERGRLDAAPHPFMTTLGSRDQRITTRYHEKDFLSSLFSTLHEAGHALYEAGCREDMAGTPLGRFASLGVHESQSRLWENLVGRSRAFAKYLHTILQQEAPTLGRVLSEDELWKQLNRVKPSFIRVEADEVTYSLHVVIRMLLEEQLVSGALSVRDLPEAWNALYQRYLGIQPPTFGMGVMQDVHWFSGSIGYFPTYVLGNLYGASFMQAARKALPDLDRSIEQGQFAGLLGWLRENIHQHGMRYQGPELVRRLTGEEATEQPFLRYLREKFTV